MEFLQSLIAETRALRKEAGVEEKAAVPVEVRTDAASRKIAEENREIVERLARVSEIRFVDEITAGLSKHHTAAFDLAVVYEKKIDVAAERERLTKEIAKLEKGLGSRRTATGQRELSAKAPAECGRRVEEAGSRDEAVAGEGARGAGRLSERMIRALWFPTLSPKGGEKGGASA